MFRDYAVRTINKENGVGIKWTNYYLTYAEVTRAKERVSQWVDEVLDSSWTADQLVNAIIDLPVPQRVVLACGEFKDDRNGWQFFMPSTREVLEFEISDIDSDLLENGVVIYVTYSATSATDIGFWREEKTRRISSARYRKEVQ